MIFWKRFYDLCRSNDTFPNPLGAKLGIPSSTIAGWKKGSYPNAKYLDVISDYFDVSTDYLLGKTNTKQTAHNKDEQSVPERLKPIYENISEMSDTELRQAEDYVRFLLSQRNQEPS